MKVKFSFAVLLFLLVSCVFFVVNMYDDLLYKYYYCESLYGAGSDLDFCFSDEFDNIKLNIHEYGAREFNRRILVVERGLFIIKSFVVFLNFLLVSILVFVFWNVKFR